MGKIEFTPARRERVPLLVALTGPTGSGKTVSALRIATGITRVTGGKIALADTESGRALHYAEDFSFHHFPFGAPFSSLRYLEVVKAAVDAGFDTLVIDSGSHEHEGAGGLLEAHDTEALRLSKRWKKPVSATNLAAWAAPKRDRQRLINTILQLPINLIVCFRAKEKLKIVKGEDPVPQGWMAIAGSEWVYEMGVNLLLLPGARGVPTLKSKEPGEMATIKVPGWAQEIFSPARQCDEEMGAALAQWAAGSAVRTTAELLDLYPKASDAAAVGVLERDRLAIWHGLGNADKATLRAASKAARVRLEEESNPAPVPDEEAPAEEAPTPDVADDGTMSEDEERRMEDQMNKAEADAMQENDR